MPAAAYAATDNAQGHRIATGDYRLPGPSPSANSTGEGPLTNFRTSHPAAKSDTDTKISYRIDQYTPGGPPMSCQSDIQTNNPDTNRTRFEKTDRPSVKHPLILTGTYLGTPEFRSLGLLGRWTSEGKTRR